MNGVVLGETDQSFLPNQCCSVRPQLAACLDEVRWVCSAELLTDACEQR